MKDVMDSTGAPIVNYDERFSKLPRRMEYMACWFFVRQEPECEATRLLREALMEYDATGQIKFKG